MATQAAREWPTYGGNLASQRYSALDQINKDNFKDLQIAWRLNTNFLGPRPDTLYSSTPLYINNTLYTTAGARQGAGRGLSWWQSADGRYQRILYVTPGWRQHRPQRNSACCW